ncbi:MAG: hypothetical protein ACO2PN_24945 [Pyrobaculum sp.]|jgi:H+/Cl- antiporter ClcA
MMALFIAAAAVAVERFINRRRLRLHEMLSDVGWLALLFVAIEFAYLFFVETLTLNYGALARSLWYTEWPVFKALLLEAAVAVMLIFTSLWLESAGLRIELRRPSLPRLFAARPPKSAGDVEKAQDRRCDIEWHEAS